MRAVFTGELEQLRLQVEVMAVLVDENLARMERVLASGEPDLAMEALGADDAIDAMLVSLTQRSYDLLGRQNPMAGDLRLVVSVLRMLEELERIGDLALRVVNAAPDQPLLATYPPLFRTLQEMAAGARRIFRVALDAWSSQDLDLAQQLSVRNLGMDDSYAELLGHALELDGPDATRVAVAAVLVGRALERIADHTVIMGERLRYLLTGDPAYLASEIR
jgi:phosphate transport system protein